MLRRKINDYYSRSSAVPATSYEGFAESAVQDIILASQPTVARTARRRHERHRAAALPWIATSPIYVIPALLWGRQTFAFMVVLVVLGALILISHRLRPAPLYDYPVWVYRLRLKLEARLRRR